MWAFYKSSYACIEYEELCFNSDKKIFNHLAVKCQIDIIERKKYIIK